MTRPSKISRLPRQIRDELNRRLDNREQNKRLVQWLNSLPETQSLVAAEFAGQPISPQNLSDWKKSGLRNWQLRQAALEFTQDALPDELETAQLEKMSAKLIRCLQIRYAAVAGSLPPPDGDPDTELRRLAGLSSNLTAMRRGDLSAERLSIEQQRLALEKSRTSQEMEKIFWEWTKRPGIQEKLYPHRDPEKMRREVERMLNRRLLGIRDPGDLPDENADPAILI